MRGWQPHRIGLAFLVLYMIFISFLCVKLVEENKALREQYNALVFFCNHIGR